jgi:type I restriction enzyme S subunit
MNLAEVGSFKIPFFSTNIQIVISDLVQRSERTLNKSFQIYSKAERVLLEAVGLADFKSSTENTNIKTFAQSFGESGRLDAEYYQPKYEGFKNTIKSNPNGYTLIKYEYDHLNTVSRKLKEAYHYIEISDVNVSDGTNSPNYIETSELPDNAKYEVQQGDLIISKVRPNRGAVTVIESNVDDLIVSGAFTVLREKPESLFTKEVLKVLLRTPIYREWMLQFNVGTQYPVIRDDDILNLPIPKIDLTTQINISKLVQQSFILKAESEHLLNVAKCAVEVAIEQDEAAGLLYIQKESEAASAAR